MRVRWVLSPFSGKPPGLLLGFFSLSPWYSAKVGLVLGWVQRLPPGQTAPRSIFKRTWIMHVPGWGLLSGGQPRVVKPFGHLGREDLSPLHG